MTNEMKCVSVGCEEEGKKIAYGLTVLTLCLEHLYEVSVTRKQDARRIAKKLDDLNPDLNHSEGWTYVIRLANGLVKIGFTGRDKLERFGELSARSNEGMPVEILAIIRGGETREMAIHERWMHLRVLGRSELFYPDYSLLDWAKGQGIDPEADQDTFTDWQVRRHANTETGSHEMWGGVPGQIEQLESEGDNHPFWN